jgi:DNA-binding MarR family transcriptional regulator
VARIELTGTDQKPKNHTGLIRTVQDCHRRLLQRANRLRHLMTMGFEVPVRVVSALGRTRGASFLGPGWSKSMASLRQEIAQEPPFFSLEEEALLNLLRSADCLNRAVQRRTRAWGVTSTQYNVLRILRGARPDGLTCAAIGDRMITAEPDITRLLRRLKSLKLISQRRDRRDRRAVWTQISEAGLELLEAMVPTIQEAPRHLLGHLSESELAELIRLLELARSSDADQPPLECEPGSEDFKEPSPAAGAVERTIR